MGACLCCGPRVVVRTHTFRDGSVYHGEQPRGARVPDGRGKLTYPNGDVYDGEFHHGRRQGRGLFVFFNGDVYNGQWLKNRPHGRGRYVYASGSWYEGDFYLGEQSGNGIFCGIEGDEYRGGLARSKPNGYGVFLFSNGNRYCGVWRDGLRWGEGEMIYFSGAFYRGDWVQDKRDGEGEMRNVNGDTYRGSWKHNLRHGFGEAVYASGVSYSGLWKFDVYHGHGRLRLEGDVVYEGDFRMGQRSGRGTLRYRDGKEYSGEWRADKRTGTGTFVYANGQRYEGGWLDDERSGVGTQRDNSGAIVYAGYWEHNKRAGFGTLVQDQTVYRGVFKDGKRDGDMIVFSRGDRYVRVERWDEGVFVVARKWEPADGDPEALDVALQLLQMQSKTGDISQWLHSATVAQPPALGLDAAARLAASDPASRADAQAVAPPSQAAVEAMFDIPPSPIGTPRASEADDGTFDRDDDALSDTDAASSAGPRSVAFSGRDTVISRDGAVSLVARSKVSWALPAMVRDDYV